MLPSLMAALPWHSRGREGQLGQRAAARAPHGSPRPGPAHPSVLQQRDPSIPTGTDRAVGSACPVTCSTHQSRADTPSLKQQRTFSHTVTVQHSLLVKKGLLPMAPSCEARQGWGHLPGLCWGCSLAGGHSLPPGAAQPPAELCRQWPGKQPPAGSTLGAGPRRGAWRAVLLGAHCTEPGAMAAGGECQHTARSSG